MKAYVCKSCGAELLLNDDANFTICLYCGNNIAISEKEISDLNIKKIIPFTIEKEEAIENFNRMLSKDIKEVKKVYVPVRYCNFDFDYLLYYEYKSEDSEGHTSYHDAEELIDGKATNDFIFSSKIKNVYFLESIRKQERINYDPVILKDVSIEYAPLLSMESIKFQIDDAVSNYSWGKISKGDGITRIYSRNYFTYNIEIEPFSTLIPIYMVKTRDGMIYNLPGVHIVKEENTRLKKICKFVLWLLIIYFSIILIIDLLHNGFTMKFFDYLIDNFKMFVLFFGNILIDCVVVLGIFILPIYFISLLTKRNGKFKRSFDNYESSKYSFRSRRKKIK